MPLRPDEFFKRKILVLARFTLGNLTTWEVEEEELGIQSPSLVRGQPGVRETLSENKTSSVHRVHSAILVSNSVLSPEKS